MVLAGLLDYHRKDEIAQRAFEYALPLLQDFVRRSNAQSHAHKAGLRSAAKTGKDSPISGTPSSVMPQMVRSISLNNGSRAMWSDGMDDRSDEAVTEALRGSTSGGPDSHAHITYKSSMDLLAETFAQGPGAVSRARSLDFRSLGTDSKEGPRERNSMARREEEAS
jgi:hypothetical protein